MLNPALAFGRDEAGGSGFQVGGGVPCHSVPRAEKTAWLGRTPESSLKPQLGLLLFSAS